MLTPALLRVLSVLGPQDVPKLVAEGVDGTVNLDRSEGPSGLLWYPVRRGNTHLSVLCLDGADDIWEPYSAFVTWGTSSLVGTRLESSGCRSAWSHGRLPLL